MYDGNQLRCTDTGIAESWSILLDHLKQLWTIALNHSTQSVTYQLSGFVTLQTELSHQCVSSIDSLAEVHVVCVNHCTGGIGHGVGSMTFQSCGNSGYLVLFSQFRIIASPCFRCLIDDGNTGTDGTCHYGGLRGKHSHEVATQSHLRTQCVDNVSKLCELSTSAVEFPVNSPQLVLGVADAAFHDFELLVQLTAKLTCLLFLGQ